jgi:adenylate cyclase
MQMRFDRLERSYWDKQVERVEAIRARVASRDEVVTEGSSIPSEEDLSRGVAKRLNVAVLIIDIVASSKVPSETRDEQDVVVRVYDLFFTEMIRIAEEYGGTVEKNTGDGLLVYFSENWNDVQECASYRAVGAVLTMKYVLKTLINPILAQTSIEPLQIRAGIDWGPVSIARIGAARRFANIVAIGNTANLASKMLKDVGAVVLIGANVFFQLPDLWKKYCSLHDVPSNYVNSSTGSAYQIYRYNGEWIGPL